MRLTLTIAPLLATSTLAAPTCSRWCGGSSHGQCLGDRCFCAAGWTGEDCSYPVSCPADCSGHGGCGDDGVCVCDAGWSGAECNVGECGHE